MKKHNFNDREQNELIGLLALTYFALSIHYILFAVNHLVQFI
jgi:hypothetical protein